MDNKQGDQRHEILAEKQPEKEYFILVELVLEDRLKGVSVHQVAKVLDVYKNSLSFKISCLRHSMKSTMKIGHVCIPIDCR